MFHPLPVRNKTVLQFFIGLFIICSSLENCCCMYECANPAFFGTDCAYYDYRQSASHIGVGSQRFTTGNRCMKLLEGESSITIKIDRPMVISWVRIILRNESNRADTTMHFMSEDQKQSWRCQGERIFVAHGIVMDIMCASKEAEARFIKIEGNIESTCSVFISRGRNNRLYGKATQGSVYEMSVASWGYRSTADKCIDGNLNTMCHTYSKDKHPWWYFTFTIPAYVYYYQIVNRPEFTYRSEGHVVIFSDNNHKVIWMHNDTENPVPAVSFWYPTSLEEPVIQFKYFINENLKKPTLNIMEMEIYSDLVCPDGSYGAGCKKKCNCADSKEACFHSTGGCPDGCAIGFDGQDCREHCPPNKYGVSCARSCNERCDGCNHINGNCDNCKSGYYGTNCVHTCKPGTYGFKCSSNCSLCANPPCIPQTGVCKDSLCQSGWQGERCDEPCHNLTWGQNCRKICSANCAGDGLCRSTDGACVSGCKPGYGPPTCSETESNAANLINLMYIVIICFLAIIVLLRSLFLCLRKQKVPLSEGK